MGALVCVTGSSPLTRGKLDGTQCPGFRLRLIPAHAGKTTPPAGALVCVTAHPRSRGENSPTEVFRSGSTGSSPLTRGKRGLAPDARVYRRLIPAHAGKTGARSRARWPAPAHPRSRGENAVSGPTGQMCYGSSPLTRGKLCVEAVPCVAHRLIPAHAGKTGCESSSPR